MRFISRLWSLVRGSFSKKVRDLEWRSPEIVLEEAENQKRRRAGELLEALAKFRTAVDRRRDRLKKMLVELQLVEDRLATAQDRQDTKNGPELLRRQRLLSEQVHADRTELEAELHRRDELEGTLKSIQDDIERFGIERHRMTAEIRALQAQRQAQEIQQQFFTETQDSPVAAIQERLQDERNRANLVTEMTGGSMQGMASLDRQLDEQAFAAMCRPTEVAQPSWVESLSMPQLTARRDSSARSAVGVTAL